MKNRTIRDFIFRTRLLAFASFAVRLQIIIKYNIDNLYLTFIWLLKKSEFTNFNYDITSLNKKHLAVFIATITNQSQNKVMGYFDELESDHYFNNYLKDTISKIPRGHELSENYFFGRRLGWYALLRIFQPLVVVETGTDKGLGTLVMAQALRMNGKGGVYTLDSDTFAGALIDLNEWQNIKFLRGNSVELLGAINKIDFFIHDSNHDRDYEYSEYVAIENKLSTKSLVLSDNAHVCDSLLRWSTNQSRNYAFFKEEPLNHWHSGDGIGVSY